MTTTTSSKTSAPSGPTHYALDRREALVGEIVALVKATNPSGRTLSDGSVREFARDIADNYIDLPKFDSVLGGSK